jgi:porin
MKYFTYILVLPVLFLTFSFKVLANDKINDNQDTNKYLETRTLDEKLQGQQETEIKTAKEEQETENLPWYQGPYATGNWHGARTNLEDHGVTLEVTYYAEPFLKTHGGLNNHSAMKYLGLVDYGVTFDTEKMGLWKGGTIFVLGQNVHGHGLTEQQVGDIQTISSIDASDRTQLSEYWIEQEFIKDRFKVKVGKMDANGDFSIFDVTENYINSSFTLNPTIPMPTYPEPAIGGILTVRPYKGFIIQGGVFDGETDTGHFGFRTTFDGDGGAFVIAQPSIEHNYRNLPGKYIAGFWYHSGDLAEITTNPNPRLLRSHYGFYTGFSQMLFRENSSDEENLQGLTLHAQYGWTPAKYHEITNFYGAGLSYTGLIPHRNDDVSGIGVAIADISNKLSNFSGTSVETALELFYRFQITPFLAIQPDLQYIFNPNGIEKDALAIGVRTIISF